MAEDKTFRYGLIVLGFFLIMIGMFIMSVDKPHIYITFCCMGVFLIFIGITWSICQCYPKITFTPVDMETVPLSEKSDESLPGKPWSTTSYTSSKDAERYESTLPSYEQIQIHVKEPGEPEGNQSAPQDLLVDIQQPKLQAKVEIHMDSISKEEHAITDAMCQSAPLACLKEDTNVTTSNETRSSASSLQSCEDWQPQKQDVGVQFGGFFCGDGIDLIDESVSESIEMIDAPLAKAIQQIPTHDGDRTEQLRNISIIPGAARDCKADDLYYGMKDETDNQMPGFESDLEH
ncbi:barttin [Gastrophryne carolinensis]